MGCWAAKARLGLKLRQAKREAESTSGQPSRLDSPPAIAAKFLCSLRMGRFVTTESRALFC